MEALHFLKFWRSPSALLTTRATDYSGEIHAEKEEEEESFFELDITQENARNTKTTNHVKVREIQLHDIEPQNKRQGHVSPVSPAETVRNLSHDLFFRNRILPIESTSKPQYPVPVLKSGTKLASLSSLGLKKPKAAKSEPNAASSRENFGRGYRSSKGVTKEVIQRYLKLIKPLYARVSKRYGERLKLSDLLSLTSPSSSPAKVTAGEKQTNNPAGFRVVRKHLRKSRSASAGTGVSSPANSRRDDSLLQQDDGIQSAILHCKRSFNSSRGSGVFSRSSSYSTDSLRISTSTDEISETNYLLRF